MKFSEALEYVIKGEKIRRTCWNSETFLWVKEGVYVQSDWCIDTVLKSVTDSNGGSVYANSTLCMYDGGNTSITTGYTPSQVDMFAYDWVVVEKEIKFDINPDCEFNILDLIDGTVKVTDILSNKDQIELVENSLKILNKLVK